jgi:outer membrane protein OmpA-like peptidoglycan-associated protein
MTRSRCAVTCVIVALHACARPVTPPSAPDLWLRPAASYLVAAFDRFPLVAFSEPRHGAAGTPEFMASLVRQPGFAGTVNDIVVEFGNARYQDVVDRYVAGDAVERDRLKGAWENTTIATGVWTAPMYEEILIDIRRFNASLPRHQRIRVLLGDPPIDWTAVRGPADEDMNDWRDAHYAWVVEQQVMNKGRRALLWIGGAHISRGVRFPDSLIHLLDRRFADRTHVALAIDERDAAPHVIDRLRVWPALAAAPVRGTWLGRADAGAIGLRLSTGTVEQNMDAAVFWGSPRGASDQGPLVEPGTPFAMELERRRRLADATVAFRGGRIRFEADSAALTPDSVAALEAVLAEVRRDPELHLLVKAFTDAREAGGLRLSTDRADAVVNWLVARGVSRARLVPKGCAASRALWVGDTERERAANRRAELVRTSTLAGCVPPPAFGFRD